MYDTETFHALNLSMDLHVWLCKNMPLHIHKKRKKMPPQLLGNVRKNNNNLKQKKIKANKPKKLPPKKIIHQHPY